MLKNPTFKKIIQSDWILALFLLLIFLCTNGYIYGWDDQHLELPLLKKLIDPALYPNDYYVDTLKLNFTSYFYPILSKIISTHQIPAVYLALYLLSRYTLFLGVFKVWNFISQRKDIAFYCTTSLILLGRVEEFLYRTFSHQEFALSIIIFGLYYFYRERFILSALLLGIAANFHAVYSLFPMFYVGLYLFIFMRRHSFKTFALTCGTYLLAALPVIIWIIQKIQRTKIPAEDPALDGWYFLYTLSCPQNFLFNSIPIKQMISGMRIFFETTNKYWLILGLYFINVFFHKEFRKDRKVQTISIVVIIMLIISYIFTYIKPSRFILDLNLIRNIQFLLFFLTGYTVILTVRATEQKPIIIAALFGIAFAMIRFMDQTAACVTIFMSGLFLLARGVERGKLPSALPFYATSALTLLGSSTGIYLMLTSNKYGPNSLKVLAATVLLIIIALIVYFLHRTSKTERVVRRLFIIVPFVLIFASYGLFHYQYLKKTKEPGGFWQLQRNWIDMQHYVRENTPKNALLLVPHDTEMGGFRIRSERPIICSYRDCGVVGFDYRAAVEWYKRVNDIWSFKVFVGQNSPKSLGDALIKALKDYKVNYVVFMKYAEPGERINFLEKVYENEVLSLYKVNINPILNTGETP